MSLELMSRLKEVEAVAASRIKDAQAFAQKDVAEACETAKLMVEEARLKAVQMVKQAETDAASEAQHGIDALKRDSQAEEDLVCRKVSERLQAAVALILRSADLAA